MITKKRRAIPAKTRDSVFREFNHRCALCGANNPHLHHIDEDPSNNDIMNLLPLCPNCHLTDQHNPTARLAPERLALFRTYKDPAILSPQFEPLFKRLRFLDDITDTHDANELSENAEELCSFISVLNMGEFYSTKVNKLVKYPPHAYVVALGSWDPEHQASVKRHHKEYREQLRCARHEVYSLAVELLRYQDGWTVSADRKLELS
jgi:hypothetical protein